MRHVYSSSKDFNLLLRFFLYLGPLLFLIHGEIVPCVLAANGIEDRETVGLEIINIDGLIHTKQEVILRLLPRPLPGKFTQPEIEEFERRVRNLSLFDQVMVMRDAQTLKVEVREKITLAPILDLTTGSSLKDLNATVGVVEYNLGGTGTKLGGQFNYSQRGPNIDVWLAQHPFEPDRWAKEIKGSYKANEIRFADSSSTWTRKRAGGELELIGPYRYASPLRYEVVLRFYRELIADKKTSNPPPSGYYVGLIPELVWDKYHWNDLVPWGYRITFELRPGYFFGADQQRHGVELHYLQGLPLGTTTVLMINSLAEAVNNSKNPNHSFLIGSIAGIRGLSDNLFRNRAQAYTNLELRHAISIAPRWAVQGVLFTDFGTFQSFTEEGKLRDWRGAVNVGAGIRIVPTFLSNTLLRVDVANLFSPSPNSIIQIGITQYF